MLSLLEMQNDYIWVHLNRAIGTLKNAEITLKILLPVHHSVLYELKFHYIKNGIVEEINIHFLILQ